MGTKSSIFYAGSSINLFTLQSGGYIFFNQDLMQITGQPLPYDTVREGKWTFDVFQQYIKAGTSLNGAADYTWNPSGQTVYGQVGYGFTPSALLAGADVKFIETDNDGKPVLAIGGEGKAMDIASQVEKASDKINSNIEKTMDRFD